MIDPAAEAKVKLRRVDYLLLRLALCGGPAAVARGRRVGMFAAPAGSRAD